MKQPIQPSTIIRSAAVVFAWVCWLTAYWQSNFWWVVISLIPYLLSNSYGHLWDEKNDTD
jgi:hypothetical protein